MNIGKFEIVSEIGKGTFGTVYRARDTMLDLEVALKVLRPAWMDDRQAVEMFYREARAAARLDHSNIVDVRELGDADGRLYIAMRLIEGESLGARLTRAGAMTLDEALPIVEQVAAALTYAHGRGLVHRDIKPNNILLRGDGRAFVTDFGLVRGAEEASRASSTSVGAIVGTPEYVAPEVWKGQGATSASDAYAFGCVVYEMLTGKAPFVASSGPEVMFRHFQPRELKAISDGPVKDAIAGALEFEPGGRLNVSALSDKLVVAARTAMAPGWAAVLRAAKAATANRRWLEALALLEDLRLAGAGDDVVRPLEREILSGELAEAEVTSHGAPGQLVETVAIDAEPASAGKGMDVSGAKIDEVPEGFGDSDSGRESQLAHESVSEGTEPPQVIGGHSGAPQVSDAVEVTWSSVEHAIVKRDWAGARRALTVLKELGADDGVVSQFAKRIDTGEQDDLVIVLPEPPPAPPPTRRRALPILVGLVVLTLCAWASYAALPRGVSAPSPVIPPTAAPPRPTDRPVTPAAALNESPLVESQVQVYAVSEAGVLVARNLKPGNVIRVKAAGTWCFGGNSTTDCSDADGRSGRPDRNLEPPGPMPEASYGRLVGKIGGRTINIGREADILLSDSGSLVLLMNDRPGNYSDNSGAVNVVLTLIK